MISVIMFLMVTSFSSLSIAEDRIAWPDCLSGLTVALIAAWLSVYTRHLEMAEVVDSEVAIVISAARSIALNSDV